jgi:hypothetical protein
MEGEEGVGDAFRRFLIWASCVFSVVELVPAPLDRWGQAEPALSQVQSGSGERGAVSLAAQYCRHGRRERCERRREGCSRWCRGNCVRAALEFPVLFVFHGVGDLWQLSRARQPEVQSGRKPAPWLADPSPHPPLSSSERRPNCTLSSTRKKHTDRQSAALNRNSCTSLVSRILRPTPETRTQPLIGTS